jgi:hypothetical protein
VFLVNVAALDVVEHRIPGLTDHWLDRREVVVGQLLQQRVVHHPDARGIGQTDGRAEDSQLVELDKARYFTVAVRHVETARQVLLADLAGRPDGGDSRPNRTATYVQRTSTVNEGLMAHLDAGHVGDRIHSSGPKPPDKNSQFTGAIATDNRLRLGLPREPCESDRTNLKDLSSVERHAVSRPPFSSLKPSES